jgi:hypothetical protein
MIIVYMFASVLGALTTVAALSPWGWLIALVSAPFGGSALTLIVAVVVVLMEHRKSPRVPWSASAGAADLVRSPKG